MASHHTAQLNNGQWNSFFAKFCQSIAIFYIILIVVQLCQASPSNENTINKYDNLAYELLAQNSPNGNELNRGPTYIPKELLLYYLFSSDGNQYTDPMERFRKYDPADRSFIRFGRSADQATKQIKSKFLKQYFNYMKRPAGGDRSFLRFGRSVN